MHEDGKIKGIQRENSLNSPSFLKVTIKNQ